MQVRIRSPRAPFDLAARAGLERRLRLALGRFAGRVARATATLEPGPAAPAWQARLTLRRRDGSLLRIADTGADPAQAVAAAAARASRRLGREAEAWTPGTPAAAGRRAL